MWAAVDVGAGRAEERDLMKEHQEGRNYGACRGTINRGEVRKDKNESAL